MTPTPEALRTVLVATIADLWYRDWKQRTTLPLAKVLFRVPESQLLLIKKCTQLEFSLWFQFLGNIVRVESRLSRKCERAMIRIMKIMNAHVSKFCVVCKTEITVCPGYFTPQKFSFMMCQEDKKVFHDVHNFPI